MCTLWPERKDVTGHVIKTLCTTKGARWQNVRCGRVCVLFTRFSTMATVLQFGEWECPTSFNLNIILSEIHGVRLVGDRTHSIWVTVMWDSHGEGKVSHYGSIPLQRRHFEHTCSQTVPLQLKKKPQMTTKQEKSKQKTAESVISVAIKGPSKLPALLHPHRPHQHYFKVMTQSISQKAIMRVLGQNVAIHTQVKGHNWHKHRSF